jgi:peptidoglycan/LPS O-acetylase OafA/YrhL
MSFLSRLRRRINRDDGKLYQVGNRPLGAIVIVGLLVFVGAIALWQLHIKTGLSVVWPLAVGCVGLFLAIVGSAGNNHGPRT